MPIVNCSNCQKECTADTIFFVALQVRNTNGGYYAFKDLCLCKSCKDLVIERYKEEIQEEYAW